MRLIFIFILCFSCALPESKSLKRRSLEKYYLANGQSNYRLSQLPFWANFSSAGKCRIDRSISYFDLNSLRKSFNLTYEEAIQTQLMYNDAIFGLEDRQSIKKTTFEVEERLFLSTNQKIQQGLRTFNNPKYEKVSVIWIDPILSKKGALSKALSHSEIKKGHPVLLSFCLSRLGLEKVLKVNGLERSNTRLITAELMSPYAPDKSFEYDYALHLKHLFKKDKQITIFSPRGKRLPRQIKGRFNKKHF